MTSDADTDEGLAGLREALEPFLREAKAFSDPDLIPDDWPARTDLRVRHFRRLALAASRLGPPPTPDRGEG